MTISVNGLQFYRPTANVNRQYTRDGYGNIITSRDNVSITDLVLSSDVTGNLIGVYDKALSKSINGLQLDVAYPSNTGTHGLIKSVNVSDESDFVNVLVYTIEIEAIPSYMFVTDYRLINSQENYSSETPYDQSATYVVGYLGTSGTIGTGIYYNKPTTETYSNDFCYQAAKGGKEPIEQAQAELQRVAGYISGQLDYENRILSSLSKSSSEDGCTSINATFLSLPANSSGNILVNVESTESYNHTDNYSDASYKITFSSLGTALNTGLYVVSGDFANKKYGLDIIGVPSGISSTPYDLAKGVMEYYIDTSGGIGGGGVPGLFQNCEHPTHKRMSGVPCWNTKSLTLEHNRSNNSATLNIQQTTQNIGNCDLNGYRIDYSIAVVDGASRYVEVPNWSYKGSVVQDIATYGEEAYEYSIDVQSILKCAPSGTGIVNKAKSIFSGIDIMSGTGSITSYIINANDASCSLKITQYRSTGLQLNTIGYEDPEE